MYGEGQNPKSIISQLDRAIDEKREYFNMSIKDTLKTWSLMESLVSVMGLISVLIVNYFIH
jgi:hypothetical protein